MVSAPSEAPPPDPPHPASSRAAAAAAASVFVDLIGVILRIGGRPGVRGGRWRGAHGPTTTTLELGLDASARCGESSRHLLTFFPASRPPVGSPRGFSPPASSVNWGNL